MQKALQKPLFILLSTHPFSYCLALCIYLLKIQDKRLGWLGKTKKICHSFPISPLVQTITLPNSHSSSSPQLLCEGFPAPFPLDLSFLQLSMFQSLFSLNTLLSPTFILQEPADFVACWLFCSIFQPCYQLDPCFLSTVPSVTKPCSSKVVNIPSLRRASRQAATSF